MFPKVAGYLKDCSDATVVLIASEIGVHEGFYASEIKSVVILGISHQNRLLYYLTSVIVILNS